MGIVIILFCVSISVSLFDRLFSMLSGNPRLGLDNCCCFFSLDNMLSVDLGGVFSKANSTIWSRVTQTVSSLEFAPFLFSFPLLVALIKFLMLFRTVDSSMGDSCLLLYSSVGTSFRLPYWRMSCIIRSSAFIEAFLSVLWSATA